MRAYEFISESISDIPSDGHKFSSGQMDAIRNAVSTPELSMNNSSGSQYLQWRFGIAMAGAPDYPTPPVGPMAGDPLLCAYSDVELEIINKASKAVGANHVKKLSDNRSSELSNTNKTSPIKPFKGYPKK